MSVYYADSSALVKLAVDEPESGAVARLFAGSRVCSSILAQVEVVLAASRVHGEVGTVAAELALRPVDLIALSNALVHAASGMPGLRALDAIHVATALSIRADLDGFVTYDRRLEAAAEAEGLIVLSPG